MNIREISVESDAYKKQQMKKRKRNKRRLFFLKLFLFFVLTSATLVSLALSPLFNIRSVEVTGGQHYKDEYIIGLTDVIIGNNGFKTIGSSLFNILTLRYGKAEGSILKSCPYIKHVSVKYKIPSKVKIEIAERVPICAVPYMGTNLIMDNEGYILDTVSDSGNKGLILVRGFNFDRYEVGQKLQLDSGDKLYKVLELMKLVDELDAVDKTSLKKIIKSIDISDIKKVCLDIDSRIAVNLGDLYDLRYRLSFLKQLLAKNIKKEDKGLIDFTAGENPYFMPEKKQ